MENKWALGLVLLAMVGIGMAFAMHKGLINPELPIQFNPTPQPPSDAACPAKEMQAAK